MSLKLAIVNGPNLNWLGRREEHLYGRQSWEVIWQGLKAWGRLENIHLTYFQSNSEGVLIDYLQEVNSLARGEPALAKVRGSVLTLHPDNPHDQADGILLNPAAYAHTSVALRDCVASLSIPVVEVHLSKIHQRESFRQHSYIAEVAQAYIVGFGAKGYLLGLELLKYFLKNDCSQ